MCLPPGPPDGRPIGLFLNTKSSYYRPFYRGELFVWIFPVSVTYLTVKVFTCKHISLISVLILFYSTSFRSSLLHTVLFCKISKEFLLSSSRPRLSRGNVLASRSKVLGFKSGWSPWIFSGHKNPEHKSSGMDWDFRLVKELPAWKNRPSSKFNRLIHVLVIPKFGGAQ